MFWLISQVPEKHDSNRRLVKDHCGRTDWVAETAIRLSHNPKKGIGHILWIEADSATQTWQYCRRVLGLNHQRWKVPRNPRIVPSSFISEPRRYYASSIRPMAATGPIYLHFTDGLFTRIDHLRPEIIHALAQIGEEHDW